MIDTVLWQTKQNGFWVRFYGDKHRQKVEEKRYWEKYRKRKQEAENGDTK